MNITFIGLGIMGNEMAYNLAINNVKLTVYNRSAIDFTIFKKANVTIAGSLKEAVQDADVVFSMLSTPEAIEEVFFKKGHVIKHMKKNAIWADCTTVNPSFSKTCFDVAASHGIRFLDTPVSGSKPQANQAELLFFVGGDQNTLDAIEPYLNMMGKKVILVGPTGQGASLKMLVNVMLAQSMAIFSEAVLFGKSMGISKDFLLNFLPNLIVSAPFTKFKAPRIKDDNYDAQFPLEWMHKDLHLATVTAYETNQSLYLANLTKELFADAKNAGMERLDFSAIFKYLENTK